MGSSTKAITLFEQGGAVFRCPLCGGTQEIKANSLVCQAKHCYDISSKGTVNYLHGHKANSQYDAALFESRGRVFEAGFYDAVLKKVEDLARTYLQPGRKNRVLDAGCGEGFYARALAQRLKSAAQIFGLDNVKEAIQMAARGEKTVRWMTADLTNIPMTDGSVDVLLNVLTPANYKEFERVLAPGGVLLKVIPGNRYLQEVRSQAGSQLKRDTYDNQNIISYFEQHMELLQRQEICYTLPLPPALAGDFLRMTPMTFHVDLSRVDVRKISEITIHMECLVGKKRQTSYDLF